MTIRRLHTGQRVKVVDKASPYFNETGVVKEFKLEPIAMKLERHLWVELDGSGTVELIRVIHLEPVD